MICGSSRRSRRYTPTVAGCRILSSGLEPVSADMVKKQWTAERLLELGLRNQWYAMCPSDWVQPGGIKRISRLGEDWVLFREPGGALHMLEDRCPRRGARLSLGHHLGDRIQCAYHGVEVDGSGTAVKVPALPGCSLEGKKAVPSLHVRR